MKPVDGVPLRTTRLAMMAAVSIAAAWVAGTPTAAGAQSSAAGQGETVSTPAPAASGAPRSAVPGSPDPQAERRRIAAERAAANARFEEQNRACQQHFVVTSCVDAARKEQRQTLTRLHRAELALDETQRRENAARLRQELQDRAAAHDKKASEAAAIELRDDAGPREPSAPNGPAAVRPAAPRSPNPGVRPARAAASPADRQAQEKINAEKFEAKQREAQAHRDEVEQRNAARARSGKVPPPPLPMPGSAASAP